MNSPALAYALTSILSILTSLIAAYLWSRMTQPHSFGSSADVDMRGRWAVTTKIESDEFKETLSIDKQFLGGVSGTGTIMKNNEPVEYYFEGRLIDRNTVIYSTRPRRKTVHDYVTGILQIDNDGKSGRGVGVVVGIFAGNYGAAPKAAQVKLDRAS